MFWRFLTPCLSSRVCYFGLLWHQVAQSRGKRCSAASSYLKEAMGRKNLDVKTSAQITKVWRGGVLRIVQLFEYVKHIMTRG